MNMFTCWSVKNVLDLFVDHRLTRDADHWVAEHLQDCDSCREEAESLSPLEDIKAVAVELPAGLKESILKAFEEEETAAGWTPQFQPAHGLALLYCLALGGIHSFDRPVSQQAEPMHQEQVK